MRGGDAAAVAEFPVLAGLIRLRQQGWTGLPLAPGATHLDLVRSWPDGTVDAIRVYSETDAGALRTRGGDPPEILWRVEGDLTYVLDQLAELPPPDAPTAPRLALRRSGGDWITASGLHVTHRRFV